MQGGDQYGGRGGDGGRRGRGGGDGGENGDGFEGAGNQDVRTKLLAILLSFSRSLESLPQDIALAVKEGVISPELLRRYLQAERSWIGGLLRLWKPFRDRFLADPQFLFKIAVQELIGNGTALASEIVVRGDEIWDEMEYVASDLIVGTVVEAAFVWILAPRVPFPSLTQTPNSGLVRFLGSLPSHCFEASSAARRFNILQRIASFFSSGFTYAMTGLGSGVVGTGITYGLISARQTFLDPEYEPHRPLPPVIENSLGWGAFMLLSANTRFQFLEGLELLVNSSLRSQQALVKFLIISLRFGNNYYGGVQFIQFFRWLGLQESSQQA